MVPESPSSNYEGKTSFDLNIHSVLIFVLNNCPFMKIGRIVLIFETIPIEWKWRDIQSRGGVAGITFARPGKYNISFSVKLSVFMK
jgi:hypothetical protein